MELESQPIRVRSTPGDRARVPGSLFVATCMTSCASLEGRVAHDAVLLEIIRTIGLVEIIAFRFTGIEISCWRGR